MFEMELEGTLPRRFRWIHVGKMSWYMKEGYEALVRISGEPAFLGNGWMVAIETGKEPAVSIVPCSSLRVSDA